MFHQLQVLTKWQNSSRREAQEALVGRQSTEAQWMHSGPVRPLESSCNSASPLCAHSHFLLPGVSSWNTDSLLSSKHKQAQVTQANMEINGRCVQEMACTAALIFQA